MVSTEDGIYRCRAMIRRVASKRHPSTYPSMTASFRLRDCSAALTAPSRSCSSLHSIVFLQLQPLVFNLLDLGPQLILFLLQSTTCCLNLLRCILLIVSSLFLQHCLGLLSFSLQCGCRLVQHLSELLLDVTLFWGVLLLLCWFSSDSIVVCSVSISSFNSSFSVCRSFLWRSDSLKLRSRMLRWPLAYLVSFPALVS